MPAVQRREDLLTREEAATYIGMRARWLDDQAMPRVRFGNRVYYRRGHLDELIDRCTEGEWDSTSRPSPTTGTSDSSTADGSTAEQQARATVEKLREELAASGQKSKPPPLHLVSDD